MTTRKLVGLGIAVIFAIGALGTHLEAAAPSLKLVPVLTGLSAPIFVTNARDGSKMSDDGIMTISHEDESGLVNVRSRSRVGTGDCR